MLVVTSRKGMFLSVYVDDIKMAGRKHNMKPMWKKLERKVYVEELTALQDQIYLVCTQWDCKTNTRFVEEKQHFFGTLMSAGTVNPLDSLRRPDNRDTYIYIYTGCFVLKGGVFSSKHVCKLTFYSAGHFSFKSPCEPRQWSTYFWFGCAWFRDMDDGRDNEWFTCTQVSQRLIKIRLVDETLPQRRLQTSNQNLKKKNLVTKRKFENSTKWMLENQPSGRNTLFKYMRGHVTGQVFSCT